MGKNKSDGGNAADVKREHPLQAIVFADSFSRTFRPVTLEKPKVLLPLLNVPMLEYTIEFLASSGVKEIIVFAISHCTEIEEYLKTSKCAKTVPVKCISSSRCLSAGDALRELDRMQVIRSDPFIMIPGDVVTNMNLKDVVREHQERKRQDSNSIMTIVLKKAGVNHPTKASSSDLVLAIDNHSNQILLYDDDPKKRKLSLSTEFLKEHSSVAFRHDLLDCHIDICSPDVLVQFSDNFDYQDIRRDFVHNEVQNIEIGHKIHAKVINQHYSARVHDPYTYDAVCKDIIHRWAYPMVPEYNLLGITSYSYRRGGRYIEKNVSLAQSCKTLEDIVIGKDTIIGSDTIVSGSVIGRNCKIGNNVVIHGSYLWNNVTIEDNVVLEQAIICDNCVIKEGSKIGKGSILSFGVVIGENFTLPEFSKVTKCLKDDDDGFSNVDKEDIATRGAIAWDSNWVGKGGEGKMWTLEDEKNSLELDDEDIDKSTFLNLVRRTFIGAGDLRESTQKVWNEWEPLSSDEEDENEDLDEESTEDRFFRVVREMVQSGDKSSHDINDVFLEIKSFKFAQNRSFSECINAIIPALLEVFDDNFNNIMSIIPEMKKKFDRWAPVLKRCIISSEDEMAVIKSLENYALKSSSISSFAPVFRFVLQLVYELDIVSEDKILEWYAEKSCSNLDPEQRLLVDNPKVKEFVEWLEEDDESDEEESD